MIDVLTEYHHPTAWSREEIMEPSPADFAERLVSGMSDAIIYADAEGVIRMWNRGATRIFGFAEAEALGRSLDLIIPKNLRERHWQGFHATMHTGQSRYGDGQILSVPAVRKDGTRVSVEFTIVPFTDDAGQMIGIAAIMRDATARFEELRALRRQLALHPAANP
jgi:PAS domain S-box-containing protein